MFRMRSKLIITRFYLRYGGLLVCFDKAPEEYARKSFYGYVLPLGGWGPGVPICWNWLETKNINNSEYVLERNIFA